jgi:hypothetical protein
MVRQKRLAGESVFWIWGNGSGWTGEDARRSTTSLLFVFFLDLAALGFGLLDDLVL